MTSGMATSVSVMPAAGATGDHGTADDALLPCVLAGPTLLVIALTLCT